MNLDTAKKMLIAHEALKLKPYKCSAGKLTIGVGRNIEEKGISHDEAMLMLDNDILVVMQLLDKYLPWWKELTENKQQVLVNMGFNLGVGPSTEEPTGKLLTFKNTLAAMKEGRDTDAVVGMKNSLWAKQVGKRADDLVALWLS